MGGRWLSPHRMTHGVAINRRRGQTQSSRWSNLRGVLVVETHSMLAHHGQVGGSETQLGRQVAGIHCLGVREETWNRGMNYSDAHLGSELCPYLVAQRAVAGTARGPWAGWTHCSRGGEVAVRSATVPGGDFPTFPVVATWRVCSGTRPGMG